MSNHEQNENIDPFVAGTGQQIGLPDLDSARLALETLGLETLAGMYKLAHEQARGD
jgi:hypothetical protein